MKWNAVGELDESLAQGSSSSRQNFQGAMDSKEMWIYEALGLISKCRGETLGSERTRDSS